MKTLVVLLLMLSSLTTQAVADVTLPKVLGDVLVLVAADIENHNGQFRVVPGSAQRKGEAQCRQIKAAVSYGILAASGIVQNAKGDDSALLATRILEYEKKISSSFKIENPVKQHADEADFVTGHCMIYPPSED